MCDRCPVNAAVLVDVIRAYRDRRRAGRDEYVQAGTQYIQLLQRLHPSMTSHERAELYLRLSAAASTSAEARWKVDIRPILRARCLRVGYQESMLFDVLAVVEDRRENRFPDGHLRGLAEHDRQYLYLLWPDLWSSTKDILEHLATADGDGDYAQVLQDLHRRLRTTRVAARAAIEVLNLVADVLRGLPHRSTVTVSTAVDPPSPDDPARPPPRPRRSVAVSAGSLLVVAIAILALVWTQRQPISGDNHPANPSTAAASSATASGATSRSSGQVVPPALGGLAGHEAQLLVVIPPPSGPACVHMQVVGVMPSLYLLAGSWAHTFATATPRPTRPQLWVLVGHTMPIVPEPAHHPPLRRANPTGCVPAPVFEIDHAQTLPDWLTSLFRIVFSPPLTIGTSSAATAPDSSHPPMPRPARTDPTAQQRRSR
jgi:hypothetical protein